MPGSTRPSRPRPGSAEGALLCASLAGDAPGERQCVSVCERAAHVRGDTDLALAERHPPCATLERGVAGGGGASARARSPARRVSLLAADRRAPCSLQIIAQAPVRRSACTLRLSGGGELVARACSAVADLLSDRRSLASESGPPPRPWRDPPPVAIPRPDGRPAPGGRSDGTASAGLRAYLRVPVRRTERDPAVSPCARTAPRRRVTATAPPWASWRALSYTQHAPCYERVSGEGHGEAILGPVHQSGSSPPTPTTASHAETRPPSTVTACARQVLAARARQSCFPPRSSADLPTALRTAHSQAAAAGKRTQGAPARRRHDVWLSITAASAAAEVRGEEAARASFSITTSRTSSVSSQVK